MKIMRVKQPDGSYVDIPLGKGADGKTAYEYAVEGGYAGTELEFTQALGEIQEVIEQLDTKVPVTRTINNKPLTSDIELKPSDIGALPDDTPIPQFLSDLKEDSSHKTVTDAEKSAWNAKSDFSGDYNDLTNKPDIPTIPENVSAFKNDAGYLVSKTDIENVLGAEPVTYWIVPSNVNEAKHSYYLGKFNKGAAVKFYDSDGYIYDLLEANNEELVFANTEADFWFAYVLSKDNEWTTRQFASFSGDYEDLTNKPTSMPASDVYDWAKEATKPSYTPDEVGAAPAEHSHNYIPTAEKGVAGGVAGLDANGKVPSAQLPSYVDDVLEYDAKSSFPTTGESGKIYVNKADNKTYRWGGSSYVEISASLALGETPSTAYYGNKGKAAYDHSQVQEGNPHKVSKTDVGLGNVDNVKQYSATNPPPYPVTSVNDKTGAVELSANDVGAYTKQETDEVVNDLAESVGEVILGMIGDDIPDDGIIPTIRSIAADEAAQAVEDRVPTTRKVNGKTLGSDITLSASDVDALPDTTTLADLDGDSTHRTVTDAEKNRWNARTSIPYDVATETIQLNYQSTYLKLTIDNLLDNSGYTFYPFELICESSDGMPTSALCTFTIESNDNVSMVVEQGSNSIVPNYYYNNGGNTYLYFDCSGEYLQVYIRGLVEICTGATLEVVSELPEGATEIDITKYVTNTNLSNYYTKSETYSKTEVNNLIPEMPDLDGYYTREETYSKQEVDLAIDEARADAKIDVVADVGQTIVVKEVDTDGKPTEWEAADYLDPEEIFTDGERVLLPQTTVEVERNGSDRNAALPYFDSTVGKTYIVNYNGVDYECECIEVMEPIEGLRCLGNMGIFNIPIGTDLPFLIATTPTGEALAILFDLSETITVSIKDTNAKQIHESLLPIFNITNIVPETTFTASLDNAFGAYVQHGISLTNKIIAGATYTIVFDGIEYICTGKHATLGEMSGVYAGNGVLATGINTGEPFALLTADGTTGISILCMDGNEHTVSVTTKELKEQYATKVFIAIPEITTYQEITEAINAGRVVQAKYEDFVFSLAMADGEQYVFVLSMTQQAIALTVTADNEWFSEEINLDEFYVPLDRTINGKSLYNNITLTKSDIGLGNVDNTADANKTVAKANQLTTGRKITISGGASGTSLPFDGTKDLSIAMEKMYEGYLEWGGKNCAGSLGPLAAAMSGDHNANRLAFINPNAIQVEYSDDGGATWVDSNLGDEWKVLHVTTSSNINIGTTTPVTTGHRMRMTLTARSGSNNYIYFQPRKLLVNANTVGHGLNVTVEYKTGVTGAEWKTLGSYDLAGWSGWNEINLNGVGAFGGSETQTSQTWYIRLTYANTVANSSYTHARSGILGIRMLGETAWGKTSNLGDTGHLYSYNWQQDAIFPAKVSATHFVEGEQSLKDKYAAKTAIDEIERAVCTPLKTTFTVAAGREHSSGAHTLVFSRKAGETYRVKLITDSPNMPTIFERHSSGNKENISLKPNIEYTVTARQDFDSIGFYINPDKTGQDWTYTIYCEVIQLNAIKVANEQYNKIISRGEQLIINGSGLMGDNTNFSNWEFDPTESNGSAGSFTRTQKNYAEIFTDEIFPVNPNLTYTLSVDAKSKDSTARMYSMLNFFDVDGLAITAKQHMHSTQSTTTLARELKSGDTTIYLTDASGWSTSLAYGFYLMLWNYTNSFGYTYPTGTYSRNRITLPKSGTYLDANALNITNNTITLSTAYTGATIPAGTSVSQGCDGATYKYRAIKWAFIPTTWTKYTDNIGGVDYSGENITSKFPPGTAYAKFGMLWNETGSTSDQVWITNVSLTANEVTGAATTIIKDNLGQGFALISNNSGKVAISNVSATELGYLKGVTSNVQAQLNKKLSSDGIIQSNDPSNASVELDLSGGLILSSSTEEGHIAIKGNGGTSVIGIDSTSIAGINYTDILTNAQKGTASGIAELDVNGKILVSQLPSYVDDVIEIIYDESDGEFHIDEEGYPVVTGEAGKIYIEVNTSKVYRWSGNQFVEISSTVALGETSSTAYRGDRGKIAYDHSQKTSGNPHNVTKANVGLGNVDNTSDANKPVSTAQATSILDAKTNDVSGNAFQRVYSSLIPYGTSIPANADLNTITYMKVGNYYCSKNADAGTLTNSPTTYAFMMTVSSPLSTTIDNENKTWVYRLRKLQDYRGPEYVQYCYTNGTAGNWIYGPWYLSIKSNNTASTTSAGLMSAADKIKLDGYATVKQYGAKGDGTTDDTVAFNAALAAKRVVHVPGGTYKLSGTLVILQNCRLELEQDTVLNFTQTSGNCIEMKSSATLNGNHGVLQVPYAFTGNVIYVGTTGDTARDTPPYVHWDPQWKRARYIYDVNIIKPQSNGLCYSNDGKCSGNAIRMFCDGDNEVRFIWGALLSGIRIAGAFTYGIDIENVDLAGHEDSAWNHDMRIEAVIQGCETGASLKNCNFAHLAITIQPQLASSNDAAYAKWGVRLDDCRGVDMMSSFVWDWHVARTDSVEYKRVALYGNCTGLILNEYLYWGDIDKNLSDVIYTNYANNWDKITILQEKLFKSKDNQPYFFNGSADIRLTTKEELESHFITDIVPTFTNILPLSTDANGNIYNGTGWSNGYISQNGTWVDTEYYRSTGFIPIKAGDVLYFRNISFDNAIAAGGDIYAKIAFYDANKTFKQFAHTQQFVTNPDLYYCKYEKIEGGMKLTMKNAAEFNSAAVVRLSFRRADFGADPIISKTPIEYKSQGFLSDDIHFKSENLLLLSPSGKQFKLSVDENGNLKTTAV